LILAGAQSKFDRSKYRTHDRRTLGPKFDDYSPHLPKTSDLDKLPLEYRSGAEKNDPSALACPVLIHLGVVPFSSLAYLASLTKHSTGRKMIVKNSKARSGIRRSYMDDLLKRGTAMRDRHKANTWGSVE
jgi:hypothetical protein